MHSCLCQVVLSASSATVSRAVSARTFTLNQSLICCKYKSFLFLFLLLSHTLTYTHTRASVLLLLLLMHLQAAQLQGDFGEVVTSCAKAFIFKCEQIWIIVATHAAPASVLVVMCPSYLKVKRSKDSL